MMTLAALRDASRHMEWADALVWQAVLAMDVPSEDELLTTWLFHLHFVQEAFRLVWEEEPVEALRTNPYDSVEAMAGWAREVHREHRRVLDAMDASGLGEPTPVPWTAPLEKRLGRAVNTATLGETIFQVVGHSTYHRGQINRRIRELGGTPPLVDYVAWVWAGRPEAPWPSNA